MFNTCFLCIYNTYLVIIIHLLGYSPEYLYDLNKKKKPLQLKIHEGC